MTPEEFAKLAPLIAEEKADELEMKNGLMQKREDYVREEGERVRQELIEKWKGFQEKLHGISSILKEEAKSLPVEKRKQIEQEGKRAQEKMESVTEEELTSDKSLQEILGFSNETLLWFYESGKKRIEQNAPKDAALVFSYLTYLNPKVADYWLVLGLALKASSLYEEALYPFSFAALLNEDSVQTRYQLATTYLRLGHFEDAEVEVEVFQDLINEQNLQDLQPTCTELKQKIQNRHAA